MRLIPPLTILIMLLATSLLAVIPTPELNETTNPMMVDTTEYEVAFLTILEPSDGYIYRSGEPVGMRILVANLGTQTVTDLQIEVELWKSDVGPNETLEDSWQLQNNWDEVAVCSDCYETEFETATLLGDSGYDLYNIQWYADSGHYRFITRIISPQDTDPTNNEQTVDFGVYQGFDIAARAYWDSNGAELLDLNNAGTTTCPSESGMCYDFNLNVSYGMVEQFEIPEFEIRDIEVEVTISNAGLLDAYFVDRFGAETHFYDDSGGAETSTYSLFEQVGKLQRVAVGYIQDPSNEDEYFENQAGRYVAEMGTSTDFTGRIMTDGSDHAFQIKAEVISFKVWQNITISYECIVLNQDRGLPDGLPCEETLNEDSEPSTDQSILNAYDDTFNDLAFESFTFNSRLSSYDTPEELAQGANDMYFGVRNIGLDPGNNTYEYAIDVTIDTPAERVDVFTDVNSLDPETSPVAYRCSVQRENHSSVGGGSPIDDQLCFTYHFMIDGVYEITAHSRIVNTGEYVDEIVLNDYQTYTISVVNHAPYVVLDMEAIEPLTLEGEFLLKLSGLDYDAAPGDSKNFRYDLQLVKEDGNVSSLGCINELQVATTKYCEGRISTHWLRSTHVRGVVTDVYGAEAYIDIPIIVWAKGLFEDSSGDFSYEVSYRAESKLEMDVSSDVAGGENGGPDGTVNSNDKFTDQTLGNLPGDYDSVGAWRLTQSATNADLIGLQSLKLTFPLSNDAIADDVNGTLWYSSVDTGGWVNLDTRVLGFDGFTKEQTIIWEQDGGALLSSGTYAVFIAQEGSPPSVGLVELSVENVATGLVEVEWVLDAQLSSDEWVAIYYSSGDTAFETGDNIQSGSKIVTNRFVDSWHFQEGVHMTTYQFTVRTENAFGANLDGALSNSTTVDDSVDPEPVVSNVQLVIQDTNVLVTWESSNTVDVHHWEVCRGVDPNSLNTCFDSTGTAEQMLTLKPTIKVKWFYAVSAVDKYGNMIHLGQATLDLSSGAVVGDGNDGNTIGTQVEGGLPSWTYPAIGAVVFLSVVAGVILVVRGGGGDDLDQDWDY